MITKKVTAIKELIQKKRIHIYIRKFTDVRIEDKNLCFECQLTNKHKINFIASLENDNIYIIPYGNCKFPLKYNGTIRHKFIEIVQKYLQAIHLVGKADLYLYTFKFLIEAVKYLSPQMNNGYKIPYMDELSIKADFQGLMHKMDGYGKTSQYKKLMTEYSKYL